MRSKAHYNGHPIHPALVPFPFAFIIGGFAFDALALVFDAPSWWLTGGYLAAAGVITALAAAVPGLIDYVYTVPPNSTGKQRATRHMIVNLSAVALTSMAWVVRQNADRTWIVLAIEAVAVVLLAIGGWMGGILVSRNQISVDHRYAGAGKWKDGTVEAMPGTPVKVATTDELKVDQMKLLRVGGARIVLARSADGYVAFDDRCTHRGGTLAGGTMICGIVQCPWHGSQFDVRSGEVKAGPAEKSIKTYRVQSVGNDVLLTM